MSLGGTTAAARLSPYPTVAALTLCAHRPRAPRTPLKCDQAERVEMTDDRIIEITSRAHFQEVVQNELVLVDFYTDGCPPCKTVAKIIPSLVAMFPGLTVAKIDESGNEELVEEFGLDEVGYPMIMIYRGGRPSTTTSRLGRKPS